MDSRCGNWAIFEIDLLEDCLLLSYLSFDVIPYYSLSFKCYSSFASCYVVLRSMNAVGKENCLVGSTDGSLLQLPLSSTTPKCSPSCLSILGTFQSGSMQK